MKGTYPGSNELTITKRSLIEILTDHLNYEHGYRDSFNNNPIKPVRVINIEFSTGSIYISFTTDPEPITKDPEPKPQEQAA